MHKTTTPARRITLSAQTDSLAEKCRHPGCQERTLSVYCGKHWCHAGFKVCPSTLGPKAGRGLFSTKLIPKGTHLFYLGRYVETARRLTSQEEVYAVAVLNSKNEEMKLVSTPGEHHTLALYANHHPGRQNAKLVSMPYDHLLNSDYQTVPTRNVISSVLPLTAKRAANIADQMDVVFIETMRDILPNEEIFVHYGDMYWGDDNNAIVK
jgi:hypothetical protein